MSYRFFMRKAWGWHESRFSIWPNYWFPKHINHPFPYKSIGRIHLEISDIVIFPFSIWLPCVIAEIMVEWLCYWYPCKGIIAHCTLQIASLIAHHYFEKEYQNSAVPKQYPFRYYYGITFLQKRFRLTQQ